MFRKIFFSLENKFCNNIKTLTVPIRSSRVTLSHCCYFFGTPLPPLSRKTYQITNQCSGSATSPSFLIAGILASLGMNKEEEKEDTELETILKRSILLIQKEEFQKAEQMLHLALKVAQDTQQKDGITYVYDVMANLAYDTQDFPKAQKLFVNVMQRLLADGVEANDNRMLHISLKLARIYQLTGNRSKAEEGYQFCVQNLEQRVQIEKDESEDTTTLWAMALDYYAHFLLQENRMKEAFSCFQRAYETFTRTHGKQTEQAVVLLNDLGTVSNLMGDQSAALKYFLEAVDVGNSLVDMEDLGSIYVNLGQVYFLSNMLTEAEKACVVGRRIADRHNDKETAQEAEECLRIVRGSIKG